MKFFAFDQSKLPGAVLNQDDPELNDNRSLEDPSAHQLGTVPQVPKKRVHFQDNQPTSSQEVNAVYELNTIDAFQSIASFQIDSHHCSYLPTDVFKLNFETIQAQYPEAGIEKSPLVFTEEPVSYQLVTLHTTTHKTVPSGPDTMKECSNTDTLSTASRTRARFKSLLLVRFRYFYYCYLLFRKRILKWFCPLLVQFSVGRDNTSLSTNQICKQVPTASAHDTEIYPHSTSKGIIDLLNSTSINCSTVPLSSKSLQSDCCCNCTHTSDTSAILNDTCSQLKECATFNKHTFYADQLVQAMQDTMTTQHSIIDGSDPVIKQETLRHKERYTTEHEAAENKLTINVD